MQRNTTPFDKFLELYDRVDGAPLSATANTTPILFDITAQLNCSCYVASAGYTSYVAGTAEWQIEVQVSDAADGDFLTVARLVLPGDQGNYSTGISGAGVYSLNPDARYVRLAVTKVGIPGNLTFGAYLGK